MTVEGRKLMTVTSRTQELLHPATPWSRVLLRR
jgi:hypothetical protein